MKKFLLLLLLPVIAFAYSYDLSTADISFRDVADGVIPVIDEGIYSYEPGEPMLPWISLHVAVPVGLATSEVTVTNMVIEELGEYYITPDAGAYPLSLPPENLVREENAAIYNSSAAFPAVNLLPAGGGNISGYGVADSLFCPFIYEPTTGKLSVITHLEFDITTEALPYEVRVPSILTPASAKINQERVERLVLNPSEAFCTATIVEPSIDMSGPQPTNNGPDWGGTAEWILISDTDIIDEFWNLRLWKFKKGVTTAAFDTTYIAATFSGVDLAEKIRNCIIYCHANYGTTYVVLAGDTNYVPLRGGYVNCGGTADNLPADLYYADLDGNWNADGDSRWGEYPSDGIDMYSDVYVSRLPARTAAHAGVLVDKILTYEKEIADNFTLNAMFLGGRLDSSTWGADCKNAVDPYLPSRFDSITKLYERYGTINRSAVTSHYNSGDCAVVNHCAHSNYALIGTGPDSMYDNHAYALTNGLDKIGWIYSIGCICGGFNATRCFAEGIVLAPNGGAVAAIMNSRYGWYSPGNPGGGPSDQYDQEFFDVMFGNGHAQFGVALAEMKDAYVPQAKANTYMRWCLYEQNVLGPSETHAWVDSMNSLNVTHDSTYGGGNFVVNVKVGSTNIAGATVCLFKSGDWVGTATTDSSGNATINPGFSSTGVFEIRVTSFYDDSGYDAWPSETAATYTGSAAQVTTFEGIADEDGVMLSWSVTDTDEILGFNLYRGSDKLNSKPLTVSESGRYLDALAVGTNDYYLELLNLDGTRTKEGPITIKAASGADALSLSQAYPNPSRGTVAFDVTLSTDTSVELAIYDLSGRRIATVANGDYSAGRHTLTWEGSNTSGVFMARLVAEGQVLTTRLAIVR
jgi:hypothetical protein